MGSLLFGASQLSTPTGYGACFLSVFLSFLFIIYLSRGKYSLFFLWVLERLVMAGKTHGRTWSPNFHLLQPIYVLFLVASE